jgi:hypothetical protein
VEWSPFDNAAVVQAAPVSAGWEGFWHTYPVQVRAKEVHTSSASILEFNEASARSLLCRIALSRSIEDGRRSASRRPPEVAAPACCSRSAICRCENGWLALSQAARRLIAVTPSRKHSCREDWQRESEEPVGSVVIGCGSLHQVIRQPRGVEYWAEPYLLNPLPERCETNTVAFRRRCQQCNNTPTRRGRYQDLNRFPRPRSRFRRILDRDHCRGRRLSDRSARNVRRRGGLGDGGSPNHEIYKHVARQGCPGVAGRVRLTPSADVRHLYQALPISKRGASYGIDSHLKSPQGSRDRRDIPVCAPRPNPFHAIQSVFSVPSMRLATTRAGCRPLQGLRSPPRHP